MAEWEQPREQCIRAAIIIICIAYTTNGIHNGMTYRERMEENEARKTSLMALQMLCARVHKQNLYMHNALWDWIEWENKLENTMCCIIDIATIGSNNLYYYFIDCSGIYYLILIKNFKWISAHAFIDCSDALVCVDVCVYVSESVWCM